MKTISYTGKAGGALYHHHHHDSTDNDRDDDDVHDNADDYNTGRQKLFHLEHGAVLSIEIAANHHSHLDLKVGSASPIDLGRVGESD